MTRRIRILGTMVGSLKKKDMQVKYGTLIDSINQLFDLVEICDASLKGIDKYINAISNFSPHISSWKEKYFKNISAFTRRSKKIQTFVTAHRDEMDVILQIGGLFNSTTDSAGFPVVIYTDNTTRITSRHPHSGRFLFSGNDFEKWVSLEKELYQNAAHICVRSNITKLSLMKDYEIGEEKITVIGGGVNFKELPEKFDKTPGSKFRVLFIGTDFYRKGGDLVINAFKKFLEKHPDSELTIVTKDSISTHYTMPGVVIKKPIWNRFEIKNLYLSADVFILPSRFETWGDVLLEAMAYGLPCISVYGQPMEEIIIHGETGFLVQPENENELSAAINDLAQNPELRERMGEAARKLVSEKYTWERVVDRLAPIIYEAANNYFYQPITNI